MQQLATIRDIQQQCNIPRESTQKFERDRLNESTWWAKKAERIYVVSVHSSRLLRSTRGSTSICKSWEAVWNRPMAWIVVAYAHGLERAIGSKCSKMKKEERGMSWSWSKMCNCASALQHLSTWTTELCSLDEKTKVHTPTCRRIAMNMKRRTRVGQPVSLHNTTSTGVRHSRSKMNSQSSTKEIEFTQ